MGSISDLRQKASLKKELHDQKVRRVKSAVMDVVNSPSFDLSLMEHQGEVDKEDFAAAMANKVAAVVMDPIAEFKDACNARGLTRSKIRSAVGMINEVYGLTESENYDDQLLAVATYMQDHPAMYDDLAVLK